MSTAPQIKYFDNSGYTTNLVVTTNVSGISFSGLLDSNTIDVQIDINGSGFLSDPSLVSITLPTFQVPNPLSYPEGFILERGQNIIRLRAIDLSGAVSAISTIVITVVSDIDLQQIQSPPTGLSLRRRATSVDILWSDVSSTLATGYNVYASTGQGGSLSGYLRVNAELIPATTPQEVIKEEFPVDSFEYEFTDDPALDLEVITNTVDRTNNVQIARKSQNFTTLISSPTYKFSGSIVGVENTNRYIFSHDRNLDIQSGILNNDIFGAVISEEPLFYVVTALYFDKNSGVLQESRFSGELTGNPLPLNTAIRGIKIRDQKLVAQDYINSIQKKEPTLSLIPSSTVREVQIEPFSNEVQKVYFLLDFVHRAKSFAALLSIDDPSFSGTSIPVANSQYKQNLKTALSTPDDATVQLLIDSAFDSLAENLVTPREGPAAAQVNQTFYTKTAPVKDLIISQGAIISSSSDSNAPRFVAQGQSVIVAANALAYYNPNKKRYELKVQMRAQTPGSSGNVSAGVLDTVVSGASGLSTVNDEASVDGTDTESNLALAERSQRALSSLDSGTEGGYEKTAIATEGVFNVKIVKSGDPKMMRDYDPVRQKHIGGKVDIWVKGTIERTIEETFAFRFETAKRVRFDVIDPTQLIFRARDSRLSVNNPIQEILYNPSQGLGVTNFSNLPATDYDLTGVTIVDFNTIRLNTLIPQPTTRLDDFIEGDYRYRNNSKFTTSVQPVRRVVSVVGEISGALDSSIGYTLYKLEDPLLEGESTISKDYISINQVGNVPSGSSIPVNDELHVLIGQFEESLGSVGINTFTIRVYSNDRSVVFNGPDSPNPDYLIIEGTETTAVKIIRSTDSAIATGTQVSVDYEKDENFVVTYVVNDVLQRLQRNINKSKHTTADVLVKQAIENPLSVEATVQLSANADQSTTDNGIRTAITILTDSKKTGQSIHQSDVTTVIKQTNGVDFVVQPFPRMSLRDGAVRVRDAIPSESAFISSLSSSTNAVYILTQELPYATIDNGGPSTIHRGVYKDDLIMNQVFNMFDIGNGVNQFYIIGRLGAVITGYSDDATLLPLFFTQEAVETERLERTANRVLVSLDYGSSDIPDLHTFSVTYVVNGDSGSKDIQTTDIEYITPGDLTFTYRAA